jgi:RND family efflux transporter MFP subunit
MKAIRIFKFLAIAMLAGLFACSSEEESHSGHSHDHGHEYHRLTYWDNSFELFARFEIHPNSGRIEGKLFVSHNHKPAENVSGTIFFLENGTNTTTDELTVDRPGVFPFELFFQESDEPTLAVNVTADGTDMEAVLGQVNRYSEYTEDADLADLDKIMQWQMGITSALAAYSEIPDVVQAQGRVLYDPAHYHEITSPVDGHIDAGNISVLPASGTAVEAGDLLAGISPPLASENSWTEFRFSYYQAKEAFERAQRLIENDAISLREYQLREREYEVRKAGYEHFLNNSSHGAHIEDVDGILYLKAFQNGVIAESHLVSGRTVQQGDPLFTIYNPDHLWLEVLGYRDEIGILTEFTGAEIIVGREGWIGLNSDQIGLVSRDTRSDDSGIRSRIIFSVDNSESQLSLNQPVRVRLKGNESNRVIAVPDGALFDDDSHKVLFVMHSGDQFERRFVQTGSSYGGYTAITEGLEEGERVVTNGTYPLHLMTGNVQIDDGHDH